jgi:HAD superfamily hydrolase (TIGR01549 family)
MTPATVFDLDGTLTDSLELVTGSYIDTIREFGGPKVTPEEIEEIWHLGPTPVVMEHFLGRPTPAAVSRFIERIATSSAQVRPFPGVVRLLSTLAELGHSLGVVTNATRANADAVLAASGLDQLIDTVVCSDEAKPKPAPDGLLSIIESLGSTPTESVYIGDSWVDLACAAKAGVRAIHATWAADGTCTLTHPHECVADLALILRGWPTPDRAV